MTVLPSVSRAQVGEQFRDAGQHAANALRLVLFAVGWTLAKSLRLVATLIGVLLFGAGWLAARAVWPALKWSAAAVKLGWAQGVKPAGGRRGPA